MTHLEEKEYNNIYAIPANYTDSGKILGGMLEPRNAVEAVILLILTGYPCARPAGAGCAASC